MTMPCDLRSEQLVLARMLNSINAVNEAMESLVSDDFQDPTNRVIFASIALLWSKDCEIEPVAVATVMKQEFPKECNTAIVFGLQMHQYHAYDEVKLFIENIIEKSRLRKMIFLSQNTIAIASGDKIKSEEIQTEVLTQIETIFSKDFSKNCISFEELSNKDYRDSGKDYLSYLEKKMEDYKQGIKSLKGMPTGFSSLDSYLNGLCKGHYIIIGGRPGAGKTTFALNLMYNLLKKNIKVGFFSLEMTSSEVMAKIIGIEAKVNMEKAEIGDISHIDYMNIFEASKSLEKIPLFIDDQESMKISTLISRAKRMVSANKIEILFVDYLGEIKGDGKFSTKQEEIQYVSKGLRSLAKKLHIPVICICQLNRNSEVENRSPRKSDLRESGQIEADAHSIILLHRPSTDDKALFPGSVKCLIVKNRFGKEGTIEMSFIGEKNKFEEL